MRLQLKYSAYRLLPAMHIATLSVVVAAAAAAAAEHREFFGTWGTPKQCARQPIKPGGTVLAAPIEISRGWLKQGQLWCGLKWGPVANRADGVFTAAHAQCGEDSQRAYFLGLTLTGDQLRLRWTLTHANGSLRRCPDN